MAETCANCGENLPVHRYHISLSTGEIFEIVLCDGCRHKFAIADEVEAVI